MNLAFDAEKHQYVLDGQILPSVTQVLSATGFVDATWFTPEATTRGSYVHKLVELHITRELDETTVDDALVGYFDAWKRFVDESGVDTDTWTVEKPMGSWAHRFAGTPDYIGIIGGKVAVIDLKTSVTVSASEQLQTAAYKMLINETRQQGLPVTHRFSLHVAAEGTYKLIEHKDRQDAQIFMAALACWHYQHNNGRKS